MPSVQDRTEITSTTDNIFGNKVILFNDDLNSFDHVEECLINICKHSAKDAKKIALEAHNFGKAVCYKGSMESCETVAEAMSTEGLTTSIVCDVTAKSRKTD